MRTSAVLLILLLLVACAVPRPEPRPVPSVVYSCEDGMTLRVRFTRDGAHVTTPSGEEFLLPQRPAASGIDYGTSEHELRGKGDEATWRTGRRPVGCRVQR